MQLEAWQGWRGLAMLLTWSAHLPIHLDVVQSLVMSCFPSFLSSPSVVVALVVTRTGQAGDLFCRLAGPTYHSSFPFLHSHHGAPLTHSVSLKLDHVQVIERHEVSITAEDVHVAFRVDNADVTIACRWLGSTDEAKFVFVVVRRVVIVRHAELLPLLHGLVVGVEAVVRVLNDERVHHRH